MVTINVFKKKKKHFKSLIDQTYKFGEVLHDPSQINQIRGKVLKRGQDFSLVLVNKTLNMSFFQEHFHFTI